MYTHIYFDCVNQEPWLDIHAYVVSYKNCFKIVRASRAIPGLSRKKIKTKRSFLKSFNLSKNIRRTDRRSLSAGNVSK